MTRAIELRGQRFQLRTVAVSDFWVAYVPGLDLSATGDTEGSATTECLERVDAHFRRMERLHTPPFGNATVH